MKQKRSKKMKQKVNGKRHLMSKNEKKNELYLFCRSSALQMLRVLIKLSWNWVVDIQCDEIQCYEILCNDIQRILDVMNYYFLQFDVHVNFWSGHGRLTRHPLQVNCTLAFRGARVPQKTQPLANREHRIREWKFGKYFNANLNTLYSKHITEPKTDNVKIVFTPKLKFTSVNSKSGELLSNDWPAVGFGTQPWLSTESCYRWGEGVEWSSGGQKFGGRACKELDGLVKWCEDWEAWTREDVQFAR